MGLALAKNLFLLFCFAGAAYFVHDARRNLREGRALDGGTFLADGKIRSYSRDRSPSSFRLIVGLKFFVAATLLGFGLIYLWFAFIG